MKRLLKALVCVFKPFVVSARVAGVSNHERSMLFVMSISLLLLNSLSAASLDGTSSVKYLTTTQIFRRGMDDYVRGFARLGNGFAVASRASAFMDTNISVSGQMDLGETGTLVLLNNLYFDRSITLTSGGNIKGKATVSGDAKTIFLGGDLTLAADSYAKVLHITGDWSNSGTSGDLIIDGRGHTLDIQDRAQIFVDTNVTLTLRNMTIRTGPKSINNPPIQLAALGSKLALDNVMFDLGADLHFPQGQIFIHNEVAVTGTSAFVYQSPVPSYITSGATWSFEYGTTFSVAPVTFTDCPYTVNNTYTNNKFIVLADSSSALYLSGCSLKTTFTGMRLRTGMVLFDNKVAIDTTAGVELATTTTSPIAYVGGGVANNQAQSLAWSPDSRFLAVVTYGPVLQVYQKTENATPPQYVRLIPVGSAAPLSGLPFRVHWSPDGRYIAEVDLSGPLRIFKFTGNSTPTLVGAAIPIARAVYVRWSPDGRFLAIVSDSSKNLVVYKFDGISTPVLIGSVSAGTNPQTVTWSPDGRYIAVAGDDPILIFYRFNGRTIQQMFSQTTNINQPRDAKFSPDGRFFAINSYASGNFRVYRFNGTNNLYPAGVSNTSGSQWWSLDWSPDGRYIVSSSDNEKFLRVFKFDGVTAPTQIGTAVVSAGTNSEVCWSPDGRFIVTGGANKVSVLGCNFVSTVATQGFSNGLLFGQSALGSGYNANVKVFAGAGVTLQGKMTDDSA